MRIGHFICPSGFYGAERWVLGLLNHLENGILIIPSTANNKILRKAREKGIRCVVLKVDGGYNIFQFVKKLSRVIEKEKIDVLHTHGYKPDLLGLFVKRKCKVVSTPHGWSFDEGLKIKLYESMDSFILRFFDMVCPLSKGLERSLRWVPKKKIRLVKNFIDLSELEKPKRGDYNTITYTGQLIERKRVEDLIKGVGLAKHKFYLNIIGDGDKREELESLVSKLGLNDWVKFLGFRDDRLRLLNDSGVFVLPSVEEGIPRSMMEAMGMGKLVIGTDIPGVRDLIKHGKTGFKVNIESPQEIADTFDHVVNNKKECRKIEKEGKKFIEENFSAKRAAGEYKKIYSSLL